MSTLSKKEQNKIYKFLQGRNIPVGLGNREAACSIAAINLALTGELTDRIPDCMSEVIGRWIISVQDAMPSSIRNSDKWRNLLPLAAGTGRELEQERLQIVQNWMWDTVLPTVLPIAKKHGFADEWQTMLAEQSSSTAADAAGAAQRAYASTRISSAANASTAADAASGASAFASGASAYDAGFAAYHAGVAAAFTAAAVYAWQSFDPCGLLERLVNLQ